MAWNEPGGNNQDPWGGKRNNDGPPDLDDALRKLQEKLNGLFGGAGGGSGKNNAGLGGAGIALILVVVALVYVAFGFYQVDQQERAVVLRLGVFSETKQPGLHWNPPLVDRVTLLNVTKERMHRSKETMLTEDLNIVEVNIAVQYLINDAKAFALNVRDPEMSLAEATSSALRLVVGTTEMHEVLTQGRERIGIEVQQRLQTYVDGYGTGITVSKVNIEDTTPPREVQASFDDVNKAREDEERLKNEASTYANGIIPEARGAAQRVIEEALAYQAQVVAQAEGEAQRFEKLLTEYKKAPDVTRDRLYIDAVQEVMANSSKVMVDVEGGNNMMYLPLDKIVNQSSSAARLNTESSPDLVREISDQVIEQLRREAGSTRAREVR